MYIVTLLPFRLILLTIRKIFHEKGKLPKVGTGTPKWRKLSKAACCVYNNFKTFFWSTENGFTFNFIRHLVESNGLTLLYKYSSVRSQLVSCAVNSLLKHARPFSLLQANRAQDWFFQNIRGGKNLFYLLNSLSRAGAVKPPPHKTLNAKTINLPGRCRLIYLCERFMAQVLNSGNSRAWRKLEKKLKSGWWQINRNSSNVRNLSPSPDIYSILNYLGVMSIRARLKDKGFTTKRFYSDWGGQNGPSAHWISDPRIIQFIYWKRIFFRISVRFLWSGGRKKVWMKYSSLI